VTAGRPPADRASSLEGRLSRLGFTDTTRVGATLTRLGLLDEPAVLDALADGADPDRAVAGLGRIVEAAGDRAELLEALRSQAGFRSRLIGVLGASAALAEHLARHPTDWRALLVDATTARPSLYGLQRSLLEAVGASGPDGTAAGSGTEVLDGLRRAYRRQLLTLAARDLTGSLAVEDVAGELADLAAATLTAALTVARAGLAEGAEPARLAVIGMGKCGGRELNYVSDVDVLFVAEPMPGGHEEAALRTATRLATGLVRACAETTSEGAIWPVDAALRPEGKSGPLVRTLASHEAYYRRWAKTWEFQALLKARPVAGDLELGNAFVGTVAPLVWTSAGRPRLVEEIQAMRRRVEGTLPRASAEREVKLGPGGLRDVEFAVQLLQLVHGRTDPTLRSGTTLLALDTLATGGYVGRDDATHLAAAYRFLRLVEHRLQLERLRRTHTVPDDAVALRRLGRSLGYRRDPVEEFAAQRSAHAREVRRLHEKLFYRPLLGAVARLPAEQAGLAPDAALARLAALGFADPAASLRHLEALTSGVSRRAAIQRTLLPVMLGWFADAADPDAGLLAFRQVSESLGGTPWYLRLLRDEGAVAERLARLLATSRYVADLLGRAPAAVAMLGSEPELRARPRAAVQAEMLATVRRNEDWEAAVVAVRGVRRHEVLRIACADLLGLAAIEEVGPALSEVAAATLAAALETATRKLTAERRGPLSARLAVIGMGRLGGREQGYGSDADVLFVYEPLAGAGDSPQVTQDAHDLAQELRRLLALPALDPSVVVDADLRPEGRQGPLVRSLDSYAAYYRRWAKTWEVQALLRASPVAGDEDLGRRFGELADTYRWPVTGLDPTAEREIRRIKARIEAERLPRGADPGLHMKLGRGGLADVEWTVQLLQLRHGHATPGLRTTGTVPALEAARAAGLLDPSDAEKLLAAWRLASRVRNAVLLVRGRPADSVPTDLRTLAGVGRALGYPAGETGALLEDYLRVTRRARAVVERVFFG